MAIALLKEESQLDILLRLSQARRKRFAALPADKKRKVALSTFARLGISADVVVRAHKKVSAGRYGKVAANGHRKTAKA